MTSPTTPRRTTSDHRMGSVCDQPRGHEESPVGGKTVSGPGLGVERVRGIEPPLRAWESHRPRAVGCQ
jgi:hypothetical protein